MASRHVVLAAALAFPGCAALPGAEIPGERVAAAERRCGDLRASIAGAIDDASRIRDASSRDSRLEELVAIERRLVRARTLAILATAHPDHEAFAAAESAIGEMEREVAQVRTAAR